MVTGRSAIRETLDVKSFKGSCCAATAHLQVLLLLTLASILVNPLLANAGVPTTQTGSTLERDAIDAFNRAEYDQVLKI